ncbi:uncharacterized protein LOC112693589 isoform X2 [Sipha flava]|uniref:Uncharacterized protein LOC112693589 isoform X2 n=1 Tax=Sipha flava TaxID=143950 RepID=A0A8B8GN64_9HEMI|nr:uncharacterized protein LOC112693589 isoform X2 [Sipha flava]
MNQVQRKSLLKRGYTITERIGDGEFGAILMVRSIRHDRRMIIKAVHGHGLLSGRHFDGLLQRGGSHARAAGVRLVRATVLGTRVRALEGFHAPRRQAGQRAAGPAAVHPVG